MQHAGQAQGTLVVYFHCQRGPYPDGSRGSEDHDVRVTLGWRQLVAASGHTLTKCQPTFAVVSMPALHPRLHDFDIAGQPPAIHTRLGLLGRRARLRYKLLVLPRKFRIFLAQPRRQRPIHMRQIELVPAGF